MGICDSKKKPKEEKITKGVPRYMLRGNKNERRKTNTFTE